jgi:hypothetical protein
MDGGEQRMGQVTVAKLREDKFAAQATSRNWST